jgi:hypothetical protein
MAAGMGPAMSPTPDLLMSTVPRKQAGMGSAMNDTTRELGTTLGVAVLGSILSSGYASRFSETAAQLPAEARHTAEGSLAGARVVSQQIGGSQGTAVYSAAQDAWVHGLQLSMMVGAGIILAAALMTWRFLPDSGKVVAGEVDEIDGAGYGVAVDELALANAAAD